MLQPSSREVEKIMEGTTTWSASPQSLEKPWRSVLEHISVYIKEEVIGSSQHRFVKDNSELIQWLLSMTKMSGSLAEERALAIIYFVFSKVFEPVSLLRDFQNSF